MFINAVCVSWDFRATGIDMYKTVAYMYLIKLKMLQEVMETGQTEAARQCLLLVQTQCSVNVHI